ERAVVAQRRRWCGRWTGVVRSGHGDPRTAGACAPFRGEAIWMGTRSNRSRLLRRLAPRNDTAGSPVDAAEAEVFDLEKLLDAVVRALAADAAFLHAAERRDLGRDDALVDADDAVFEGFGNPPDAADVAAVEIGGEPEFGVIR